MAEPRRLQFTTVGPASKDDNKKTTRSTVRFTLSLTESNDKSCPEFSYVELLKNAIGKGKDNDEDEAASEQDGADPDPFGDYMEDQKLEELARSFEKKYGRKPGKRRKGDGIRDLVDLGDGYDWNDPFVDNSEAYDEFVPISLTTKFGGFYINSGVLDFKEVSDLEDSQGQDSQDDFEVKKRKRTQVITSDSDSPVEEIVEKPKKKFKDVLSEGKKKKKFLSTFDKHFKKPKKLKDFEKLKKKRPSVSEHLKKKSKEKILSSSEVPLISKQEPQPTIQQQHPAPGQTQTGDNGVATEQVQPSHNDHNYVENSPEMDVDNEPPVLERISDEGEEKNDNAILIGSQDESSSQSDEKPDSNPEPEQIPKLPLSLPEKLENSIVKFKEAALALKTQSGKVRFNNTTSQMLLDIELQCRQIQCANRSLVYSHLAALLSVSKSSLIRRAKRVKQNASHNRMKDPLEKLQEALSRTMPAQLEQHAAECKVAIQQRTLEGVKEAGSQSSDSEEDKGAKKDGEKSKRITVPRKKFQWNAEIRTVLDEIVSIKMREYDHLKIRSQSAEVFLKSFLDLQVKGVWPKGWIQTRQLYKETLPVHQPWTNPSKAKKVFLSKGAAATPPVLANQDQNSDDNSRDSTPPKVILIEDSESTPERETAAMKLQRQYENVTKTDEPGIVKRTPVESQSVSHSIPASKSVSNSVSSDAAKNSATTNNSNLLTDYANSVQVSDNSPPNTNNKRDNKTVANLTCDGLSDSNGKTPVVSASVLSSVPTTSAPSMSRFDQVLSEKLSRTSPVLSLPLTSTVTSMSTSLQNKMKLATGLAGSSNQDLVYEILRSMSKQPTGPFAKTQDPQTAAAQSVNDPPAKSPPTLEAKQSGGNASQNGSIQAGTKTVIPECTPVTVVSSSVPIKVANINTDDGASDLYKKKKTSEVSTSKPAAEKVYKSLLPSHSLASSQNSGTPESTSRLTSQQPQTPDSTNAQTIVIDNSGSIGAKKERVSTLKQFNKDKRQSTFHLLEQQIQQQQQLQKQLHLRLTDINASQKLQNIGSQSVIVSSSSASQNVNRTKDGTNVVSGTAVHNKDDKKHHHHHHHRSHSASGISNDQKMKIVHVSGAAGSSNRTSALPQVKSAHGVESRRASDQQRHLLIHQRDLQEQQQHQHLPKHTPTTNSTLQAAAQKHKQQLDMPNFQNEFERSLAMLAASQNIPQRLSPPVKPSPAHSHPHSARPQGKALSPPSPLLSAPPVWPGMTLPSPMPLTDHSRLMKQVLQTPGYTTISPQSTRPLSTGRPTISPELAAGAINLVSPPGGGITDYQHRSPPLAHHHSIVLHSPLSPSLMLPNLLRITTPTSENNSTP